MSRWFILSNLGNTEIERKSRTVTTLHSLLGLSGYGKMFDACIEIIRQSSILCTVTIVCVKVLLVIEAIK